MRNIAARTGSSIWYAVSETARKLFDYLLRPFLPGKWNPEYYTMRSKNARRGVIFILPFIIGFIVFMLRPLLESLSMSFNVIEIVPGAGYNKTWNSFSNYRYALRVDSSFSGYLLDQIVRMLINSIATLVLSFVIAVILNQEFKGRTVARVIFFLPVILASGVLPGIEAQNDQFNIMQGMTADIASSSGFNLSESIQSLISVSGVASDVFDVVFQMIDQIYDIVMSSGIQIIVFLGGLQTIPRSLYEAADVEGCSGWESFWKITFPMVSPLLLVNGIYTIIDFFMKNDNTVVEYINTVMYTQFKFGESAAMSWIYFGVAALFIGIFSLIISLGVHYYED